MIILTLWLFALNNEVLGACKNLLSETNVLQVKNASGQVIANLTRCRHLVDDFPHLCKEEYGDEDGVCCKLCWTNNLNCIDGDINKISWDVDGKRVGCKKYVQGDISRCQTDAFASVMCCKSCREAFQCQDFLSDFYKITVTAHNGSEVFITRCEDVVSDYLSLCRGDTGKRGGSCCESCSKYDLSCIDDTLVHWEVNGVRYGCAEYVAGDHCRCENAHVADKCCASCTGKECKPCRDFLSEQYHINVTRPDGMEVMLTNCTDLLADYLSLCKDHPGQLGGHCCQACEGQDLTCVDDALYTFFPGPGKRQGCAEYVAENPCHCEEIFTSSNCCSSCQGKVCSKCQDLLGPQNFIDVLDKDDNLVERLMDCVNLTERYLYLCKWYHGQKGGKCCHSCSQKDLSCIDDGTFGWPVGDQTLGCTEYVEAYPDKCTNEDTVQDLCCASCAAVKGKCVDDTTFTTTINLKIKTKRGKEKVKCKDCSCADVEGQGKQFVKKACKKKKYRVKDHCCDLCAKH